MKHYQTILFDLDGTLTDSGPGIRNSVAYALRRLGCPVPEQEVLNKFIGPPLLDSFQRYCGLDLETARRGTQYYREYFRDRGIFENSVYPGIPALLADLKAAGRTVAVATSKPEVFARRILDHFGLAGYFDFVAGATMDETRLTKPAVLAYALEAMGLTDKAAAVMVGDREQDVLGARAVGLDCIGVLYGYGDRAEHEAAGAAAIAGDVAALRAVLL